MKHTSSNSSEKSVLSIGFGKAGSQLHLPNWINAGYSITAYDTDSDKLEPVNFPVQAQEAYESGDLHTVRNLADIAIRPTIVDVVTASGHHIDAVEQTLESLAVHTMRPKAWLIEKPVVSDESEAARLRDMIETGALLDEQLFVNENYNASRGIEYLKQIIEQEASSGNDLTTVDVVFYKDRVPDVLKGRFTDPVLGAYGIELPHQLAIAYNLANVSPDTEVRVLENNYSHDVNGIDHSESTYTTIETEPGMIIRLAQGLGPFRMNASGDIIHDEEPGITRYATASFADGRSAQVLFDPAPGVERFHSVVIWQDTTGKENRIVIADNTLARVLGSVARYAETGVRETYTEALSADNAINYALTLAKLRESAAE